MQLLWVLISQLVYEVLRSFKAAYEEAGGKVLKELYPKLGTNDFSTYLQEASSLKPDVIYSFFAGSDGIRYIQQYEEFGLKDKIPMSGSLEFGDLLMTEPTGDGFRRISMLELYTHLGWRMI